MTVTNSQSGTNVHEIAPDIYRISKPVSSDEQIVAIDDAPFDREENAVLVACQKHYESAPSDTVAEVRVIDEAGAQTTGKYAILHRFERRL